MTTDVAAQLADAAAALYALTPGDFTAARNQRSRDARAAGDKDLAAALTALKKPSASAWLVNMLVRHRADEIGQVLDLGASLREAQQDLDADELRELGRQRQKLVAALTREGRRLASDLGERLSDSAADEVGQTLQAAMVDPWAAAAVRTGALVRPLSATGVEPADLTGAVAVAVPAASVARSSEGGTKRAAKAKPRGPSKEKLAAARALVADAEKRASDARARIDAIDAEADELAPRRTTIEHELDDLRARVHDAEAALADATRDADRLDRERSQAERAADDAERKADQARAALDRLTR
ncbi:hypothetical protein [Cryobacterium tepidiphilum]|uniref:hypothetical protein n=1 Tax=Cryobacterium tepidiphilum TaxID=2486026 RepID=UPI0011CE875D|nr:hypothetical protein [Cryobacterium tepidiphilum]